MAFQSADLVSDLLIAGVLTETPEGLAVSDRFREREAVAMDDETAHDGSSAAGALSMDTNQRELFVDLGVGTDRLAARRRALDSFIEGETLDTEMAIETLYLVTLFGDIADRTDDSVPDGFLPVRGDRLEALLNVHPQAVVYVWREDCPPCNVMRDRLATIGQAGSIPPAVSRFAVYGPAHRTVLEETYGIFGAPTTVVVLDGRVDVRLAGVYSVDAVISELEQSFGSTT